MLKALFSILILSATSYLSGQKSIAIDSLSSHLGEFIKVCSKVDGTHVLKGENKLTYLNLGGEYPNQKLTLVIFPGDAEKFENVPAEYFKNKSVCVTGMAATYKERIQIVVKNTDQITEQISTDE